MRLPRLAFAPVLALVACLSCASPTLPLPPPEQPVATTTAPGMVHLVSTHGAEANAIIVVYNNNPTVADDKRVSGAQADAFGSWDCDVVASSGDVLSVTQQVGLAVSPPIDVQVP